MLAVALACWTTEESWPMKIREVHGLTVEVPPRRPATGRGSAETARDYVVAIVETDEGPRGVGYGPARNGEVASVVQRNLRPLLVGEDPLKTELLWERMYVSTRHIGRTGLVMRALSAVDIALWDLRGQVAALPLYKLLGGHRDVIPALASGGYALDAGVDALAEEMAGYAAEGYAMVKMRVGALAPEDDLRRVQAARAAIGPQTKLMIDVNGAWSQAKPAIKLARQMAECGLAFIEEPFGPDNLPALKAFNSAVDTPVAVGESESGRWAFRDLLVAGAADVLRHDATLVGGISEWMKVTALAAAWNVLVLPHHAPEVHAHLVGAVANALAVEVRCPRGADLHELVENPIVPEHGMVTLPSRPGLGLMWNWKAVERLRTER
jgi:D-arabinonate dehydratase